MNQELDIEQKLKEIIDKFSENTTQKWIPSTLYYKIKNVSIDEIGEIGEKFLKSIFEEIGYEVEDFGHLKYDYDLIIKDDCENIDYKIEVKTATEGESGTFQHEGIKNSND